MLERCSIPYLIRRCLPVISLLFCIITQQKVLGQSSIHGRIRDTILKKDCPLAVVALLNADSVLVSYTRSHKDGSFIFYNVDTGDYRILITHPAYSEYSTSFVVTRGIDHDLGIFALLPKADTLTPVIVMPRAMPPKMHGDTLEYNTANIKTRANATVEELLIRLPGIQVDPNGNITANGKRIQHLLVDGEDLFGGDPTIVTRNFNADMIAKVQILEKKSAQTEFTGVDDGQRIQTLNLALKEDSKRGYFLKAEAGCDPQGYYNMNGLLGAFKGHRQFAALGLVANNGATGFNGNVGELGSELNLQGGSADPLGASAGNGIPRTAALGTHYANKWNGNEDHLTGNYNYGNVSTRPFSSYTSRQTLPDSIYTQQQHSSSINSRDQHALTANYDYNPDSVSSFRFSFAGETAQEENVLSSADSSSFNDTLVNSSQRIIHSNVDNKLFRGSVMWQMRGRKKRSRTFSLLAGIADQDNSTNGFLYSLNNFYKPDGNLQKADTTDQRKVIQADNLALNTRLSYTEPLWKNTILATAYSLSMNRNRSTLSTYGRGNGKYDQIIDSVSSRYLNNVLTQGITLNLQGQDRTFGYTIGGDITHFTNKQTDQDRNTVLSWEYINLSPRMNARWNINNYRGFNFDYNGSTQQPSITQLQPVQNNNDPLHITLGNPDLRPSFIHDLSVGFHNFIPIMVDAKAEYGLSSNSISTRTITDSLGRQISQAVNVQGTKHGAINLMISQRLKRLDVDVRWNMVTSFNQSMNYLNQYLSQTSNYYILGGVSLNKFVADKYNCLFSSTLTHSSTQFSLRTMSSTHYWTQNATMSISIFPFQGLEINNNANYSWRQKLDQFDKKNMIVDWDAYIIKSLFSNQMTIRLTISDILGQNEGINRGSYANVTTETRSNVIGRYWMLSAAWRFVHHRK